MSREALETLAKTIELLHEANKIERKAAEINAIIQTVDRLKEYIPRDVSGHLINRAMAAQSVIIQQLNEINQRLNQQIEKTKEVIRRDTEDTKKDAQAAGESSTSKEGQDASTARNNTTQHA